MSVNSPGILIVFKQEYGYKRKVGYFVYGTFGSLYPYDVPNIKLIKNEAKYSIRQINWQ